MTGVMDNIYASIQKEYETYFSMEAGVVTPIPLVQFFGRWSKLSLQPFHRPNSNTSLEMEAVSVNKTKTCCSECASGSETCSVKDSEKHHTSSQQDCKLILDTEFVTEEKEEEEESYNDFSSEELGEHGTNEKKENGTTMYFPITKTWGISIHPFFLLHSLRYLLGYIR